MPVWTCNCDLDELLTRDLLAQAMQDPWVVSSTLNQETTGSWVFRVDTGNNPRPANDELWEFLRRNSEEERFTNREIVGFERQYLGQFHEPNLNGDTLTPEVREQVLRAWSDPDYRLIRSQRLNHSMAAPLQARMDYSAVARRTFLVEEMPEGARPFYLNESHEQNDPVLIPPWLVEGVWIENTTGIVAKVFSVNVNVSSVTLDGWRTGNRIVIDLRGFDPDAWRVISEPKEGLPWYERVDLDELV